ncbi:MAG: Mur ligase domain-containing protein, partial [bacterium]|nr:Mur ligase domain-containing protein [bacterium]
MSTQKIYMVGIGGIGMSALAQYYVHEGIVVTGSDREESPTTAMLAQKGIKVIIGQKEENVREGTELLVYSDAVLADNPERMRAVELEIPQQSYFEALGEVAETKRTIAVAGTHGKTTTTAMLGRMLVEAGLDPTVVVGSIVTEWGSNFRAGAGDLLVVEACEYRNHFLAFRPEILVITNIELDHTDFFKSTDELKAVFDEARRNAKKVIEVSSYKNEQVPELLVPGEFNKENARAAKAAAKLVAPNVPDEVWDRSLASYKGTWRRFEYKGQLAGGAVLYDDYAHHPTAIARTVVAAREKFPGKKIVLFFHPHLYSRTRDLFDDFAKALASADEAYILPVYAAREPHDPTVSNTALAEAVNKKGGHAQALQDFTAVTAHLRALG